MIGILRRGCVLHPLCARLRSLQLPGNKHVHSTPPRVYPAPPSSPQPLCARHQTCPAPALRYKQNARFTPLPLPTHRVHRVHHHALAGGQAVRGGRHFAHTHVIEVCEEEREGGFQGAQERIDRMRVPGS